METFVRTACSCEDILAVKALDDRIFAGFHGIEVDELLAIQRSGSVLMLMTHGGELIGESQILFSPFSYLPYDFAESVGFCYGTGIAPGYQGRTLGVVLANEQERLARIQKKRELHLTVRVENYPSINMRMGLGFRVVSYLPFFYGPDVVQDSRLLMVKKLDQTIREEPMTLHRYVPVNFCSFDPSVHSQIAGLCAEGFIGYQVDAKGICFRKG